MISERLRLGISTMGLKGPLLQRDFAVCEAAGLRLMAHRLLFLMRNCDSGSSFLIEAERRANEFINHGDVTDYFRSYPADKDGGESALASINHKLNTQLFCSMLHCV